MPIKFEPVYTVSSKVAQYLMRIEAAKEKVFHLPMTPAIAAQVFHEQGKRMYKLFRVGF